LIVSGFEVCTGLERKKIEKISEELKGKRINPRDAKIRLAKEIVGICYSLKAAQKAEEEFNKVFREKELPSKMPEIKIKEKSLNILDLLMRTKLVSSKAEAKRLVLQRGVKISSQVQNDWKKEVEIKKGLIVRVGKRKFVKLI